MTQNQHISKTTFVLEKAKRSTAMSDFGHAPYLDTATSGIACLQGTQLALGWFREGPQTTMRDAFPVRTGQVPLLSGQGTLGARRTLLGSTFSEGSEKNTQIGII